MRGRRIIIPALLVLTLSTTAPAQADPKNAVPEEVAKLLTAGNVPAGVLKARSILEKTKTEYGSDALETADAAQNLSLVLSKTRVGEKAERIALAKRSLAIKRRTLDSRNPSLAASLYVLGLAHYQSFDYPGSVPHFREALAIMDDYLGPHHEDVLVYVREYGSALHQTGHYQEALEAFQRQAVISGDHYGQSRPETLSALRNVALARMRLDQFSEAEQIYLQIIQNLEISPTPDPELLATTLRSLSAVLAMQGRLDDALRQGDLALELGRTAAKKESGWVPRMLSNLANLLWKVGDLDKARRYLTESLALQVADKDDPALALRTGMMLAMTELDSGSPDPALEVLQAAEFRARGQVPPDDLVWSPFYYYRGTIKSAMDDHASAISDFRAAIQIRGEKNYTNDFDTAEILGALGVSELAAGQIPEALEHLAEASRIMEPITGRTHPAHVDILDNIAIANWEADQVAEAASAGLEAAGARYDLLTATVAGLPERQALAFAGRKLSGDDVAIAAALKGESEPIADQMTFDAIIRSRALVFDEFASRRIFLGASSDPATGRLIQDLQSAKADRAHLFLANPAEFHGTYSTQLDQAADRIEAIEIDLARKAKTIRAEVSRRSFDSHDLANSLPPASASVSYVRYTDPSRVRSDRYAAVIQLVVPTSAPRFVDLGEANAIEAAIDSWRGTLLPHAVIGIDFLQSESRYQKAAGNLRKLIWDPISTPINEAKTVFIVPDGAIGLVSFAALSRQDGVYLLESGPVFHYLTAERDLAIEPSPDGGNDSLLAIGNPAFNSQNDRSAGILSDPESTLRSLSSECTSLRSMQFSSLPETRKEAKAVRRMWKAVTGTKRATLLLGADATEERFRSGAGGRELLHVATHGFFLGDGCSEPGPSLRGIGGLSPRKSSIKERTRTRAANPLLLSGLVFAGANSRKDGGEPEKDGIVTAEEIAALDLGGVRLAVVSACRSGAGSVITGEGVFGLQRAFLAAGVDTVVTSLWEVEDQAGREWIRQFYRERLVHKRPVSQSIALAGQAILSARRAKKQSTHPFYWAGWLATGNYD